MLNLIWGVAILFILLWVFGFAFHFLGGFIHLLLALAVISVLVRLILGRRVTA